MCATRSASRDRGAGRVPSCACPTNAITSVSLTVIHRARGLPAGSHDWQAPRSFDRSEAASRRAPAATGGPSAASRTGGCHLAERSRGVVESALRRSRSPFLRTRATWRAIGVHPSAACARHLAVAFSGRSAFAVRRHPPHLPPQKDVPIDAPCRRRRGSLDLYASCRAETSCAGSPGRDDRRPHARSRLRRRPLHDLHFSRHDHDPRMMPLREEEIATARRGTDRGSLMSVGFANSALKTDPTDTVQAILP